ncbi:helix-turn-helix domain-containing protein [Rhizobium sp. YS-1r]|uniref:helix-turn-helix domain-containing protein n=1 Tax=Rhizobium sp. YS-1r TaxID=1532558 RepID=UPI00050EEC5A|nr:helix-turn-helix domain-containing protein [Rhizobium sp. YS-1r]KGE02108.1 AraC family transcriptional regulator [Rhizobium sp. YS-1r]
MLAPVPTYDLYGENRTRRPDFWLHCETIASRSSAHQWEIGRHRHESFQQFLYIRNGSGDAILSASTVTLVPPCVVAVPPGVSHGFRFSRDIDGMVITLVAERLRLTAGLAKRPGDWLSTPRMIPLPAGQDAGYLNETFSRLFAEFEAQRASRNDLVEAYLTAAILILGRLAGADSSGAAGDVNLARVEALKDLIGRHFRDQLPAEAYAKLLNLSPTHLNRVVREVTGMSVHDLIMARVVDEARRALVFTTASVQAIADGLGFSDAAYFSRCFRKRTGQTPRQYREAERASLRQVESPVE